MSALIQVAVHASQFPEQVRRDLLESLRTRWVNQKFHYDSFKQTQKWLALHEAYSPARTDPDCAATYGRSFEAAAARIASERVHLIGLGCGGGQKDARLLQVLQAAGKEPLYTPVDVSLAMVLVARQTALAVVPQDRCFPVVADLAVTDDWLALVEPASGLSPGPAVPLTEPTRLLTFFGLLPNLDPQVVLPRLAGLLRPADYLLLSANLAPGPGYAEGLQRILPLYDNALTRDWLMTFLLDLGLEATDGQMRFGVEEHPAGSGLKRVVAYFKFLRPREVQVEGQRFWFAADESIGLFYSYRHTPALVRDLLVKHGLRVLERWITRSEEEGVFLVSRA